MFENNTYENLLQDVLENAPEDIDTREGSVFYDAVSGILIKIAKFYTDLELIFSLSQIETASGEYLDMKASEYGVTRHDSTKAMYQAILNGNVIEDYERFFYNGFYFVLHDRCFIAEEAGTKYNYISSGTSAVPVDSIPTLASANFGEILQYGVDSEDDESLRRRLKDKISGAGENGNRQHYKIWCESVDGVGKARIYPLWNGPNTVKAVIISPLGLACGDDIVDSVQQYVDPNSKGLTVSVGGETFNFGDGLGEGVANIGAHFTAVSAIEEFIDVNVKLELKSGADIDLVKLEMKNKIAEYLKNLIMSTADNEDIIVRISAISSIIADLENVIDHSNLHLNGGTDNVSVEGDKVPVTGVFEVEFV